MPGVKIQKITPGNIKKLNTMCALPGPDLTDVLEESTEAYLRARALGAERRWYMG